MSPKSKRAPSLVGEKIGRKLAPEALLRDAIEHPLGIPRLSEANGHGSLGVETPPLHETDGRSSIGQVIRLARKEKGISQEELARKAQLDRTTVARVECGIFKTLSSENLEGIAWALGLDLKAFLFKAESMGEALTCRSDLNRVEFSLDYPEEGFRIVSLLPKRREFFFGKIEIKPQKTIISAKLPHPEQVYLHVVEGKIHLTRQGKEYLLKPGDCFAFSGFRGYELYNPDQFKTSASLFITYPSFLSL